ncbi:Serine/arginine repetitive matrix protein 2 [Pseudolycoriella hygida]|uniref:Serine/arginine repetitive matrix protein 2 n=1 Tax=Pseudolycoriella hygida TaxID=35572 RepID=A0A9Q0S1F4_9DIPT|nr:Serine/arginine repetitive matrix protein 2 [Pseudolycoriella hygida]
MYNGIGLPTARGSGTNGHVQRNYAFVRPGKKDNITYKSEDDLAKLDAANNRQPNQGILDHERKRQLEVKCAEYEDILEKQKDYSKEEIAAKVNSYRLKLMGQGKGDLPKDEFGRVLALFDRMWKGTLASYNHRMDALKDNPTSLTRKFRPMPKVGREFFEHDTRNNSECFSYANSIRSNHKTAMYLTRSEETNVTKTVEKSVESRAAEPKEPSLDSSSTKSHHETESNVGPTTYRSFVSKSHYHGFNYQSKIHSSQTNNNKLKKKLFKIQRQLRLQTVALRRQQIAGNWCCSCACSLTRHGQMQNQFKHFNHRRNGGGNGCKFVVCNNKTLKSGTLRHPIHLQGLRSVVSVRETHQIAEAQQEKNAKLREAFGISEYFVEGSSFDPERKAKETLAKGTALQEELQAQRNAEREKNRKYALVRTPSPSKDRDDDGKKKKKKKKRDGSSSPERKKDKKKKSKKNKKEKSKKKKSRRHHESDDSTDDDSDDSDGNSSDSEEEISPRKRKKSKKDKVN